ncbi:Site-specific recombinases, DNA invertase Pin homologs [[Ruminococcus] torques L2-14]|uniref:Site-specific recombinases, DNA invertase Pin homologs n=2 Tax=Lachnospiraceae TaxID=186803 RepID=D4M217_9FIRM|nr:Site-specific recombinases, DNA invertase Pin homologs [[Ruminococcus] torques L2-14]
MKKQLDIKKLLILNLPYLLMGLFATNFGEAWRMVQGADASQKALSLISVLPVALASWWPSLHPLDLLVGLCCGAGLRLAVYLKSKNAKKYRHGMEYGSARWGTHEDIAPYVDPVFQNNVILTKTESLTMNSRPKDPKTARNKNVLVIGGSGSGKTRFWLKPNLMQMHSSYVVTDPKGTILVECGKMLQRGAPKLGKDGKPMKDKHGKVINEPYRIKVLNTINFKKSMHYNPFAYIHSEKDILKLVTTLIANTKGEGKAGDDFWVKAETLLYCALIGYIHYEAPVEEQNFSTLIEFINAMEVREDDEEFKNPVDLMFDALEAEKPNHFAVRQYKKYKLAAGVVCSKRLLNQAVGKSLRTHNLKPKKGAQVMRKNEKITALYERLSRDDFGKDDDQQRESNSISNQKAMLEEFAARQGFTNIVHFTDDGISGTCFDRPGFLAMMKEVEAGNVEYLCIKDMSRMGRDYLKVGQIMEILRQRGVRLIAINDGVDSARGDDDFTPFRNIMNEYYARDTSRKIRSTFQSKGKSGKHLTGTVIYGYLWNEARDQWLVDPEAAEVVKRIFAMTIDGYGPYQIASKLKEEKVLIPSAYLARHGEGVNKNKTFKDVYGWGSSTICNILEKREYLGHTINFKTRKHFKDKKSHYVPEDEWTIFENTHEAIIDQQTFDLVQKIRGNVRRYPDGWGEAAPLTGLLYCADCGGKMYVHRTNNGKRISQYTCSQYSKVPVGKLCTTQHRINEDVVLSLVSEMLKAIAEYAKHDRAEFVRVVQEAQSSQQTAEVKKQRIRLATAKQRVSELEVLLCKIYEDNILGKLSDSRYATLDAQYEKEQTELTAEISVLEKAIKSYEKHEKDADRFIALIDKYENFDKLTIAMLNEFIEKILVHERDRKGSIQTTQEVEIYFNFVGRFVPPAFGEVELTPEELEEIRKREERKDRLHQNYLKRKASGAQKRYEDKIKKRKKAEIEAKKAAIRAEDIAKGVFVPVSSLPQREPMKGVQTA